MLSLRSAFACSILAAAFVACQEGHIDTRQVKQEMDSRRVFHLTEAQVMAGAEQAGQHLVRRLDSAQRAAVERNPPFACTATLAPLRAALNMQGILADRLSFETWKPKKDEAKVQEVLEALRYTHSQGQTMPPNLQKDTKGGFHYTEALVMRDEACRSCHKTWKLNEEVGVWTLRYPGRVAVKEATRGMKGM